jgi:hypothetical protein
MYPSDLHFLCIKETNKQTNKDTETMHTLCDVLPLCPSHPSILVMCCVFYERVRADSGYCLPVKWTQMDCLHSTSRTCIKL